LEARSRAGRAERGAVAAPCRRHRPSLFVRTAATTVATAGGMISALLEDRSASHAARGDHHSEWRDQPKMTVCTSGKSHLQNHAAAEPQGPAH
jgi:hypothetical protein